MQNSELAVRPSATDPNRPRTLSGWCTFGLLKGPTAAAAAVSGVVAKLQGKTWKDGYDQVSKLADKHVLQPAVQFADRNNTTLLLGAAGGATKAALTKSENPDASKAKAIAAGVVVGTATAAGAAYMKENTGLSSAPGGQTGPA